MKKDLGGGFLVWHLVAIVGAVALATIIGIILYNVFSKEEPKQTANPPKPAQQPAQQQQQQEKRYQKNWLQVQDKSTGKTYAKNPEEEDGLDFDDFLSEYDPKHKYEITFAEQNDIVSGNGKRSSMAQSFTGYIYKDSTTNDFIEANGYYTFPNSTRYNDFDKKFSQQQLQQKQNEFFSKIESITIDGYTYHRNSKRKNDKAIFNSLLTRLQTGNGDGLQVNFYQNQKCCFTDNNKPDLYVKSFQGEYTEFGFPKTGTITYADDSVIKLTPELEILRDENIEKLKQDYDCIAVITITCNSATNEKTYNKTYYTPNGGKFNGQLTKSFSELPTPLQPNQYCEVLPKKTTDNPFADPDFIPIKTLTEHADIIYKNDYPSLGYTENFKLQPAPKNFFSTVNNEYSMFRQENISKIIDNDGNTIFDANRDDYNDFDYCLGQVNTNIEYEIQYASPVIINNKEVSCYRGLVTNTFLPYQGRLFNRGQVQYESDIINNASDLMDLWTSGRFKVQPISQAAIDRDQRLKNLKNTLANPPRKPVPFV